MKNTEKSMSRKYKRFTKILINEELVITLSRKVYYWTDFPLFTKQKDSTYSLIDFLIDILYILF